MQDSEQPPAQSELVWTNGSPEGVLDGVPGFFIIDRMTGDWYRKTTPIGTKSGWLKSGTGGTGLTFTRGTGSPEGVVTGSPGDTYWDITGDFYYVKVTGVATTTGWTIH